MLPTDDMTKTKYMQKSKRVEILRRPNGAKTVLTIEKNDSLNEQAGDLGTSEVLVRVRECQSS